MIELMSTTLTTHMHVHLHSTLILHKKEIPSISFNCYHTCLEVGTSTSISKFSSSFADCYTLTKITNNVIKIIIDQKCNINLPPMFLWLFSKRPLSNHPHKQEVPPYPLKESFDSRLIHVHRH